ncbi:hypothetical protein HanXRQr2_Chr03g0109471 [Helianthus annuus]|uniref:Uncharacterized protein n=1 Tax=Helianthus annuus TaxID=4232 RepID=A0A9K3JFY5_HELAN|nr:hypothetical protein HanXRQr2_Chr03g0109471 [Helianthus annuus]
MSIIMYTYFDLITPKYNLPKEEFNRSFRTFTSLKHHIQFIISNPPHKFTQAESKSNQITDNRK